MVVVVIAAGRECSRNAFRLHLRAKSLIMRNARSYPADASVHLLKANGDGLPRVELHVGDLDIIPMMKQTLAYENNHGDES